MTVYFAFGSRSAGLIVIQALIEHAASFDLLGHSRRAAEAVSVIVRLRPDIVILEDVLLDGQAIDVVEDIATRNWRGTIIMISTLTGPPPPQAFRAKGIDFWFQLPQDKGELCLALQELSDLKDSEWWTGGTN